MEIVLKTIAESWKLEAKLEDNAKYFFNSKEVDSVTNSDKCFVIGRKGSGKSAICEHVVSQKSYNKFSQKLSFKNFPLNELYHLDNIQFTPPIQHITLWKYLICSTICKLMTQNKGINPVVREKLKKIYSPDSFKSLSRTISHWTSAEFGAQVLGTGGASNWQKILLRKSIHG